MRLLVVVVILLLVLTLLAALVRYLWARLVRDTTVPGTPARRVGTALVALLPVLVVATLVGSRALPPAAARLIAWPGYLAMALAFYLLLALAAAELPAALARRSLRRSGAPGRLARAAAAPRQAQAPAGDPVDEGRRQALAGDRVDEGRRQALAGDRVDEGRRLLLGRSVAAAAGLVAAATVGSGVAAALGPPVRRRVQIPLAKLPGRYDGLRIAMVSDIHLGPILGRAHTQRIVDIVNGYDADVVAVVGDLVDGTVEELGRAAEPLAGLRSRYGAFYVTGNHEYFSGFAPWIERVSELGLRVLRNERVALEPLDIAGVNDATGGSHGDPPDYDRALAGRDPSRPVVLLAHQPIQAVEAARRGVDLQLSGHTHGGQMWPFSLAVAAQQPLVAGLGTVRGMPVYVSRGAGFWGPPVRVGAPPDVSLIVLRARGR